MSSGAKKEYSACWYDLYQKELYNQNAQEYSWAFFILVGILVANLVGRATKLFHFLLGYEKVIMKMIVRESVYTNKRTFWLYLFR